MRLKSESFYSLILKQTIFISEHNRLVRQLSPFSPFFSFLYICFFFITGHITTCNLINTAGIE